MQVKCTVFRNCKCIIYSKDWLTVTKETLLPRKALLKVLEERNPPNDIIAAIHSSIYVSLE